MFDSDSVVAAIGRWAAAWQARDAALLGRLWDEAGPVFMLGREHRTPLFTLDAIRNDMAATCRRASAIVYRPERIAPRVLDRNLASAFFFVRWAMTEPERPAIGGILKTSAVFVLRSSDWRLAHYAEASYAPYRFFTEYFEATAESGFAGQPRRGALP